MKAGELVVIVDSVESAVKFYTERLAFDLVSLEIDSENPQQLGFAHLRKGKCNIHFRKPSLQESTDFSLVKRCASRSVYLKVEMKKGIERYYAKCEKKETLVVQGLREFGNEKSFTIADPFGIRLTFSQPLQTKHVADLNFFGISFQKDSLRTRKDAEKIYLEQIAAALKRFGVLRRASKKLAKAKIKELVDAVNG